MFTFTSSRQNHWLYFFKHIVYSFLILAIAPVIHLFYPGSWLHDAYYWFASGVLLIHIFRLMSTERVFKLVIDEKDAIITPFYKSTMSGQGEKILLLDKVRIYVKKSSGGDGVVKSIQFYKGYREFMRIDTQKDGFSSDTLEKIGKTMENLGVRVTDQK